MTKKQAKALKKGDRVIDKKTGYLLEVIEVIPFWNGVEIYETYSDGSRSNVLKEPNGYRVLLSTEQLTKDQELDLIKIYSDPILAKNKKERTITIQDKYLDLDK